ncbi:MAG: response regulator [Chitinispirillaceae bacterium]|nr:response regulator [Chitinispirillaceae bacterium]
MRWMHGHGLPDEQKRPLPDVRRSGVARARAERLTMATGSNGEEKYRAFVRRNLDRVVEMLAHISVSDFSKRLDTSALPDDEFTEVLYGLELLMDDLAEARQEVDEDEKFGRLRAEIWKRAVVGPGSMEALVLELLDAVGPQVHATGACYFAIESVSQDAVCTREWIPDGEVSVLGMSIPRSLWASYAGKEWVELRRSDIERAGGEELARLMRESGTGVFLAASCGPHDIPYGLIVFADRNERREWKERERNMLFELANIISAKTAYAESAEAFRLQKLESLGTLAGGLAHDFNNILTGIIGNISIAKRADTDRTAAFEALENAEAAAFRARRLTGQFLTFSSGGAPVKEVTALGELVEYCARFCLSGSNVASAIEIEPGLNPVDIDRGQIEQVLTNLLINAKQAMPEGGEARISAENAVLDGKYGLSLDPGTYVRVTVTDTGVGIPRSNLQKIFDPYFTTKKQGSGLGLAAAHSIIRKHGGHIHADSDGRKGASFTFYLPCSTMTMPHPEAVKEPVKRRKGVRVLVMDDDQAVRMVIAKLLKAEGIEVAEAGNGPDTLAAYIAAAQEGRKFNLVIMDLTIAGGECGRETVAKLLSIDPNARAIVISGYSNDPVMSDFRTYGFRGMIPKPFEVKELLDAVDSALDAY